MALQRLARADEIPPGGTLYLCADEKPVILANWAGEIYALFGICPHQENPLEGVKVWDYLIECPWHLFQYDVRTGENHFPRNVYPRDVGYLQKQLRPLRTFPVEVKEGEIWVDLE